MENKFNLNTELVISKKVIEMITVANEYCLFVEKLINYNKEDVMLYFSRIAPLLYLKGSLMPDIEVADTDANERFVTEEEWLKIYKETKEKFKENNKFSDADNTNHNDSELVTLELSELIADIYQDLKDFVLLYQKESFAAKENAVLSCRHYFKTNWGQKVIFLMKVMHFNLYNVD